MSLKDKTVGVMMGGLSSERDISVKSGRSVRENLAKDGWNAVALELVSESVDEIKKLILENAIDVVFIAMHGGFGEGGDLQRILDNMGVPYVGSGYHSSRLAMDKVASHKLFEEAGLNVPKHLAVNKGEILNRDSLKYPVVVKPSRQGSSIGITFVNSDGKLNEAIETAFKFDDSILIEEFIKAREMTVAVLDGRALPVVEIIPKSGFFDFQAKYQKGLTDYVCPAQLDAEIIRRMQSDAVTAWQVLKCRHLCRVDMLLDEKNDPYVLEVNTIPGMTETSLFPKAAAADGLTFEKLCSDLVKLALSS